MKTRISIAIMFVAIFALFASVAHAKTPTIHTKPKAAKTVKVTPYTRCVWGPANGAAPSGWTILVCGSGKQAERPYAMRPDDSQSWDDTEVLRPVIRVIEIKGSEVVLGVNVKGGKEYVYGVARGKLPKAQAGEWYTVDPAVVSTFKAMEKRGAIQSLDQIKIAEIQESGVVDEAFDVSAIAATFN